MQRVVVTIAKEVMGRPKPVYFVLETGHHTFAEFAAALRRDHVVSGIRIDIEDAGVGKKRERRRTNIALGVFGLVTVQELDFELQPPLNASVPS